MQKTAPVLLTPRAGWYMRYQSNEKHEKVRHRALPSAQSGIHWNPYESVKECQKHGENWHHLSKASGSSLVQVHL